MDEISKVIYYIHQIYFIPLCPNQSNKGMDMVLKRKNIDLPEDTLRKLSLMAVAQGKSLKAYIENLLISKANSISVEVNENPSPSGDEWFNDPENMKEVQQGIADMKAGKGKAYSIDDIKSVLGV